MADVIGSLLALSPHVATTSVVDGALAWVDARGLPARRIARGALRSARRAGIEGARVGVAGVAIAAEVAARHGVRGTTSHSHDGTPGRGDSSATITRVASGHERAFLGAHPIAVLLEAERWPASVSATDVRRAEAALADVGIATCGELAALAADAVEVRFGAAGVALWRLARGHDEHAVFSRVVRDPPAASLEWSEYTIDDSARLVFVANRLVGRVCAGLLSRGEVARSLTVELWLDGGGTITRRVRGARASADRAMWLRLVRADIERVDLPDRVRGLALRIDATAHPDAPQGDLFDTGFQTAASAEAIVSRLIDDESGTPVRIATSGHVLPERRVRREAVEFRDVAIALRRAGGDHRAASSSSSDAATLALRLLAEPRRVEADVLAQRGQLAPARYREAPAGPKRGARDASPVDIVTAVGPDRIATGHEVGAAVAREYWQCLTDDGRLVLLFRDAAPDANEHTRAGDTSLDVTRERDATADDAGAWYLHGWWD